MSRISIEHDCVDPSKIIPRLRQRRILIEIDVMRQMGHLGSNAKVNSSELEAFLSRMRDNLDFVDNLVISFQSRTRVSHLSNS